MAFAIILHQHLEHGPLNIGRRVFPNAVSRISFVYVVTQRLLDEAEFCCTCHNDQRGFDTNGCNYSGVCSSAVVWLNIYSARFRLYLGRTRALGLANAAAVTCHYVVVMGKVMN